MRKLNLLTWHVHGNYLFYLSQIPHNIFLPVDNEKKGDFIGKGNGFPWGENVHDIPVQSLKDIDIDCIIFQRPSNYLIDQHEILTTFQKDLPKIYLEHDPPQGDPTNTRHWVDDKSVTIVHVTNFNKCMWDCGNIPTEIIPHGVMMPDDAVYSGSIKKGLVIINNLKQRGRRLGNDIFKSVRNHVPIDLIGIGSEELGGMGEISHKKFPYFIRDYRFVFNPIRYTSLGLAICESMTVGLPVVSLATTEQPTIIFNDFNGYIHMDIDFLVEKMRCLLANYELAKELSRNARLYARVHFNIQRFVSDWNKVLNKVTERSESKTITV